VMDVGGLKGSSLGSGRLRKDLGVRSTASYASLANHFGRSACRHHRHRPLCVTGLYYLDAEAHMIGLSRVATAAGLQSSVV